MQALDLIPEKIHDRSPIFLGSYDDVEEIKHLYAAETAWEGGWNVFIHDVQDLSHCLI